MVETKAEKARRARLARLFNITPEDFDLMMDHQDGKCYICYRVPVKQRLNVDHDHKSGLVRGLLCYRCNTMLGRMQDNADALERAALYLRNPPASAALGEPRYGRVGRTTTRAKKPRKRG